MSDEAPRILIVEDEASLADSVRYNLEREGFGGRRPGRPDRAGGVPLPDSPRS